MLVTKEGFSRLGRQRGSQGVCQLLNFVEVISNLGWLERVAECTVKSERLEWRDAPRPEEPQCRLEIDR